MSQGVKKNLTEPASFHSNSPILDRLWRTQPGWTLSPWAPSRPAASKAVCWAPRTQVETAQVWCSVFPLNKSCFTSCCQCCGWRQVQGHPEEAHCATETPSTRLLLSVCPLWRWGGAGRESGWPHLVLSARSGLVFKVWPVPC